MDGTIKNHTEQGIAETGGAFGYTLRGVFITDTRADVDVTASSDTGTTYAGGFVGYNNRTTIFNACATGDVTSIAPENRSYTGGFAGFGGGVHFNTFASGSVTSENGSANIGAFSGNVAWIEADYNSYYNSDAVVTRGGSVIETAPHGENVSNITEDKNKFTAKTMEELGSAEFAKELNDNLSSDKPNCDVVICTAAILLDPLSAFAVGGVGSFLGDLFFYPAPMLVSLATHGLQAAVISLCARHIRGRKPWLGAVAGVTLGAVIMVIGYTLGRAYVYATPEYAVIKLPYEILQAAVGAAAGVLLCYRGRLKEIFEKFLLTR